MKRGQYRQGEFKRIAKNAREIWILASYNPIFDARGHVVKIVKFATDVTTQKLIDADFAGQIAAISRSQVVIEFNLAGIITAANENFCKTMGCSISEIKGQHHRMFVEAGYADSREYEKFWQDLNNAKF